MREQPILFPTLPVFPGPRDPSGKLGQCSDLTSMHGCHAPIPTRDRLSLRATPSAIPPSCLPWRCCKAGACRPATRPV